MTVDPIALARMFLASLLCGVLLELFWECLGFIGCIVRYRKKGSTKPVKDNPVGLVIIFIKDILFFTIAGVVVAVLIYWTNDGQFRFLALAGLLIGFLICYKTLGSLLRKLNEQLVKLLFVLIGILTYPVRKLIALIASIIGRAAESERRRRMKRFTLSQIKAVDIIKVKGMPG
jgi:hypothetical protein